MPTTLLLDKEEMTRILERLACEVLERHGQCERVMLVGIERRGADLARRLGALMQQKLQRPLPLGTLDINLYRDDWTSLEGKPHIGQSRITAPVDNAEIILIDDVLFSGRTIRAALEALLEAKASGKIGHLGLTAHSVSVFERALELDWVETIMFPYNIVESQGADLIKRCAERNIGFIAMKPLAGGAIENASLALRYICANPDVGIVIPGMYSTREVSENLSAVQDESPLTEEEQRKMQQVRDDLGTNFCRRCNYCAPCTVGINIPSVFLFAGYLQRYDLGDWGKDRYDSLPAKADACVECGECESRCPYHLPIREMLKKCVQDIGDFAARQGQAAK